MHRQYGWNRENINDILDICFSLTNYHISLHPLRAEDRQYYISVLSALRARTEERANAGRRRQNMYRQRQHQLERALATDFVAEASNDEFGGSDV